MRDLCAQSPDAPTLSPALLGLLVRHREEIAAWIDAATSSPGQEDSFARSPARFLGARTIRWLQGKNQFLEIDPAKRASLDGLYRRALCTMRDALCSSGDAEGLSSALSRLLVECRRGLAAFVLELDRALGVPGFVFREVVSSEYSAALQRSILGLGPVQEPRSGRSDGSALEQALDAFALSEPILDLGCGPGALLVHALRREGRLAFGIDRAAEESEYVFSGDWLDWPLERGAWGTILSHQGFSNHFLHQHLRTGGEASRYARRYMEILRALKEGGAFVYAPGLPFIEELLPGAEYRVTRRPIPLPSGAPGYAPGSPLALSAYACRIERLAR